MQRIAPLIIIIVLLGFQAYASDPVLVNCKVSPEVKYNKDKIPKQFYPSNNLLRYTNKFFSATGEPIIIQGRLTDIHCVPISNAIISVWHTNSYGEYQYSDDVADAKKTDSYFTGSGTAKTDNLGRFYFVTIFPGGKIPHINLIINNDSFPQYHMKMFLNNNVTYINHISRHKNNSGESKNIPVYELNITLKEENRFLSS